MTPQEALADALLEIPSVCPDSEAIRRAPCLQDAWQPTLDYQLPRDLWWWFLWAFLAPREFVRILRECDAVRRVFIDLAALSFKTTGRSVPLPEPLIDAIHRRIVLANRPSAYRVVTRAVRVPFDAVARRMAEWRDDAVWRTRS